MREKYIYVYTYCLRRLLFYVRGASDNSIYIVFYLPWRLLYLSATVICQISFVRGLCRLDDIQWRREGKVGGNSPLCPLRGLSF